ncbi:hypothetical protein PR202_gb22410 [Eleusine coracana subsp. coracana]|uniref:BRI1 kinase inhibitor 1 n=1 Tax=Eleusine coracana subsp. coracana TaxID=191504 RepID=A0AAV5FGI3_ELECO|nr:hypothetical protein QOZ80_6AG0537650 [Eleusine coracana subsp. coracana]GJN33787.1 hypothetical protein PR202_gb22410 [Eleusine coracana subsp. coracana]
MDTPRARSSKPPIPRLRLPPPPPPALSVSATTSPSPHDLAFASASSSPYLLHSSMSRAPVGRVGSDLSHNSYSKATSNGGMARNGRTPPFFSGLGGAWRKAENSSDTTTTSSGKNPAGRTEEKRKDKARSRAADLGQWVKRHMTAVVEQLRSSFYRPAAAERERHRRRPHSFSVHGGPAKERERWTRGRRGHHQHLSSAPASLRVSPANSGHLSVKASTTSPEESSMEELQSAIEAAIAHCKSSMSRAQQHQADEDHQDGRRGDTTKQQPLHQ